MDFQDVVKQLEENKNTDAKAEKKRILNSYEVLKREKEEISSRCGLGSYLKRCAEYLSESAYLRQYRKESMDKSVWFCRTFYDEIIKRLNLTMEQLLFLWPEQVEKGLRDEINKEELKIISEEHKKFSVVAIEKGVMKLLSGKEAKEYFIKQETEEKDIEKGVLHGRPIFIGKGKIIGAVKIITGPVDFHKIENGDILVATQIPPEFIPAVSKSGAVVIDEGGVTSHASILCRELEIPGIIGTKIATKVLHDGDKVEVDTEKGIIKKINTYQ